MADTHHEVANNPIKEISYALIGTLLFLAMVLWIAIAAYRRPSRRCDLSRNLRGN